MTFPPPIIHTRIPAALQQIFLASNRGESVDIPPNASVSHLCRNWHEERLSTNRGQLACTSFDLTENDSDSDSSTDSFGDFDDFEPDFSDDESCTDTRYSKSIASSVLTKENQKCEERERSAATIVSALAETEWSKLNASMKHNSDQQCSETARVAASVISALSETEWSKSISSTRPKANEKCAEREHTAVTFVSVPSDTERSKSKALSIPNKHQSYVETSRVAASVISALSETEWSEYSSEDEDDSDSDDWSLGDSTIASSDMIFLEEVAGLNDNIVLHRERKCTDRWSAIERKSEPGNSAPRRYHSPAKYSKPRKVEASPRLTSRHVLNQSEYKS